MSQVPQCGVVSDTHCNESSLVAMRGSLRKKLGLGNLAVKTADADVDNVEDIHTRNHGG